MTVGGSFFAARVVPADWPHFATTWKVSRQA